MAVNSSTGAGSVSLPERRPRRAPTPVWVATILLYLYGGLLAVIGALALVAMGRADTTASEDRPLLIAGAGFLVVGAVLVLLARKLTAGRRWALIIVVSLLAVNAVQAIIRDATGAANVGIAIVVSVLLLGPRRSREHFGIGTSREQQA